MTLRYLRQTCANCNQALPRAARNRCPSCLKPVVPTGEAFIISCPRCERPLPGAHAGKCPTCAFAVRDIAERAEFRRCQE